MGRRGFFVQAERDSLPPHALDKLVTRIRSIGDRRLSLHKILSLDGCSPASGSSHYGFAKCWSALSLALEVENV